MDCLIVWVCARLGTQYWLWPSADQQQCLLVFPAVCPSAPYTTHSLLPSRAGVCIVIQSCPRIRKVYKNFWGFLQLLEDALFFNQRGREISYLTVLSYYCWITCRRNRNMVRRHLAGKLILGYFPCLPHAVSLLFFNSPFALITSRCTHAQTDITSLTGFQYIQWAKQSYFSAHLCTCACFL